MIPLKTVSGLSAYRSNQASSAPLRLGVVEIAFADMLTSEREEVTRFGGAKAWETGRSRWDRISSLGQAPPCLTSAATIRRHPPKVEHGTHLRICREDLPSQAPQKISKVGDWSIFRPVNVRIPL
jgi:hypothetical protein